MGNELAVYEGQQDLVIARPPEVVLEEAKKAAKSLKDVVSQKVKPVMMNGEQYLEFEDWQTLGKFYGVTAKTISTNFIDYGSAQGFEARAVAIRPDGVEISAADSMCMNDEANWKSKPLFQLRSMAQTRACAKALRNVLAWVVVLAGYKATPAEEMLDGNPGKPPMKQPQSKSQAQGFDKQTQGSAQAASGDSITDGQKKLIFAKSKAKGVKEEDIKAAFKVEHISDLKKAQVNDVVAFIDQGVVPGGAAESDPNGCPKDVTVCGSSDTDNDMNTICGINDGKPCPYAKA